MAKLGEIVAVMAMNRNRIVGSASPGEKWLPFASEAQTRQYRDWLRSRVQKQIVVMGVNALKSFGGKPFGDGLNVIVTTNPEALYDGDPVMQDKTRVALAANMGDFVIWSRTSVRQKLVLGGPTLFAKAIYWINRVELVVFDDDTAPGIDDVLMPGFEHLFDLESTTDLGFAKVLDYVKKPGIGLDDSKQLELPTVKVNGL